jgi:hypothetical protein
MSNLDQKLYMTQQGLIKRVQKCERQMDKWITKRSNGCNEKIDNIVEDNK